jgi:DNA-binding beta-propeller fold protein YncE
MIPIPGRSALWALPFLLLDPGAEAAAQGTLVVANRQSGSVSLFDLASGFEVGRLPIGPEIPHEVAVSPDGRWILSGAYGGGNNHGRHLVVMDLVNVREIGRIDLGERSRPHSMAFLPDNRRAVVTMEESDRLALVDIETLEILRIYDTGGREGHMVRLSPDGSRAYVTSRLGKGTLSVIFLEEERDPVVIVTGGGAEGIAVSPDGSEIWVANRTEGTISVVSAASLEVVATRPSHPFAGRVEISPEGYVAVPNGGRRPSGGAVPPGHRSPVA